MSAQWEYGCYREAESAVIATVKRHCSVRSVFTVEVKLQPLQQPAPCRQFAVQVAVLPHQTERLTKRNKTQGCLVLQRENKHLPWSRRAWTLIVVHKPPSHRKSRNSNKRNSRFVLMIHFNHKLQCFFPSSWTISSCSVYLIGMSWIVSCF